MCLPVSWRQASFPFKRRYLVANRRIDATKAQQATGAVIGVRASAARTVAEVNGAIHAVVTCGVRKTRVAAVVRFVADREGVNAGIPRLHAPVTIRIGVGRITSIDAVAEVRIGAFVVVGQASTFAN